MDRTWRRQINSLKVNKLGNELPILFQSQSSSQRSSTWAAPGRTVDSHRDSSGRGIGMDQRKSRPSTFRFFHYFPLNAIHGGIPWSWRI